MTKLIVCFPSLRTETKTRDKFEGEPLIPSLMENQFGTSDMRRTVRRTRYSTDYTYCIDSGQRESVYGKFLVVQITHKDGVIIR